MHPYFLKSFFIFIIDTKLMKASKTSCGLSEMKCRQPRDNFPYQHSQIRYLILQTIINIKYVIIGAMITSSIKRIKKLFCVYQVITKQQGKLSKFEEKNFADKVKISVVAGAGGNGCVSFFTDKRVRKGQPDGGCGGRGGDIILQAHKSVFDLSHFRRRVIDGNDGGCGGPRGKDGKNGGKTTLRVPCGTLVYQIQVNQDEKTMQKTQKKNFLVDLEESTSKYVIAKGGQKGKGNQNFPFLTQEDKQGKLGQKKLIFLELKTLADIGLVGFPNIGKSTFLASVSRALPKIANYQFTTLKPSVGNIKFVDEFSMTMADIPGIIEGAHMNKGLGLEFLRHIQRTKVLVFMVDITKPDPIKHLEQLQFQLSQYASQKFDKKQKIVLFNKMDCLQNSQQLFNHYSSKIRMRSFLISAKQGERVGEVLVQLRKIVQIQRQKQLQRKQKQILKPS